MWDLVMVLVLVPALVLVKALDWDDLLVPSLEIWKVDCSVVVSLLLLIPDLPNQILVLVFPSFCQAIEQKVSQESNSDPSQM